MNIEFKKLRSVCQNESVGYCTEFDDAVELPSCTEANCPLKAEEKVCRWEHESRASLGDPHFVTECGTCNAADGREYEFCPNCGGRVHMV